MSTNAVEESVSCKVCAEAMPGPHRASRLRRKGVAGGTAEKKISILEAGLRAISGSDALLLALLNAAREVAPADEVQVQLSLSRGGSTYP